jgi:hypothetical protein
MDRDFSFINVPPKIVATKGVGDFTKFTSAGRVDATVVACLSAYNAFIPPCITCRGVCFREIYQ